MIGLLSLLGMLPGNACVPKLSILFLFSPCSVHDVDAALEYAQKLKAYAEQAKEDLHIMMRVYFEK